MGPDEESPAQIKGNTIVNPSAKTATSVIKEYLLETVAEFRKLHELRIQGWNSEAGDRHFQKQRHAADNADSNSCQFFYRMMQEIGTELHLSTGGFRISYNDGQTPSILDFCMAPGGFLSKAVGLNPGSRGLAFSLPHESGGHKVLLPKSSNIEVKLLDITMLATDMGVTSIPTGHPDASNFLPQELTAGQTFDIIICDGQVLRTHNYAEYRKYREAGRLITTQLALGLEHVREGGTIIILLHKIELWPNVHLLYTFNKFSAIQVFKPKRHHSTRSSFYLVATNMRPHHPDAVRAIEEWKSHWKIATFGSEEEFKAVTDEFRMDLGVDRIIEEFGPKLVRLGRNIWNIQAEALARAPFMRK